MKWQSQLWKGFTLTHNSPSQLKAMRQEWHKTYLRVSSRQSQSKWATCLARVSSSSSRFSSSYRWESRKLRRSLSRCIGSLPMSYEMSWNEPWSTTFWRLVGVTAPTWPKRHSSKPIGDWLKKSGTVNKSQSTQGASHRKTTTYKAC